MFGLTPTGIKLALGVGAILIAFASGGYTIHKFDVAKLEKVELQYAQAEAKAVQQAKDIQAAQDKVTTDAAVAEAAAQQKIVTNTVTVTQEVTHYVKDTSTCITFGLLRLFDATVLGIDPAKLSIPAGKSNDACAPVTASALAKSVVGNYGAALANAEQLNELQRWVNLEIAAGKLK